MNKKFVVKILITLILCVSVLFCSGVSAFAYAPIFTFESNEWEIDSYDTYSQVYPKKINGSWLSDTVYSVSELNGETYFMSKSGVDYERETSVDVVPPPLDISWNDNCFGMLYQVNDTFWFFYCDSLTIDLYIEMYLSENNVSGSIDFFNFYYTVSEFCHVYLYFSQYPYTSWTKNVNSNYNNSSLLNNLQCRKWHDNIIDDNYEFLWCSGTVKEAYTDSSGNFNAVNHTLIKNDGSTYLQAMASTYNMICLQDVYMISGAIRKTFNGNDIKFLDSGECCILINDLGAIIGTTSSYCTAIYSMYIYTSNGLEIAEIPLYGRDIFDTSSDNISDSVLNEFDLNVGDYNFRDVVNFSFFDYDIGDVDSSADYIVVFEYLFISDGYNLFFPGTLEIIKFDSYDSQLKHDDIVNSISNASDTISDGLSDVVDSVNDARDDLAEEIVDAADDISSSIDNGTVDIVNSVEDAASQISDGLSDVVDSVETVGDAITEKLEDTKNGILNGIKSFFIPSEETMTSIKDEWSELLKSRFGALYEVSDIVSDFAGEMNWEYVQSAGEKNTVTMPSVTVKLVDTDFTFGGYKVSIIPDGFDVLVTALKGITSIVCTFLFINALRKKYDKLVGGSAA